MSSDIPFHFLMLSYSDKKLIQAEKDYYQKLEDFSKVFCDKLQDGSITDFDYPFYREFLDDCISNLHTIRDIMHDRNIQVPDREIFKPIIECLEAVRKTNFKWEVM